MVVRFKQQYDVSTEGFMGDLLGKIKTAFKKRPTLPSEIKTSTDDLEQLKTLLKKTVFDDNWLANAHFKTNSVSSAGILPQLSYKGTFDEKDPMGFIDKKLQETARVASRYMQEVIKYDARIQKIHAELSNKVTKYTEDGDDKIEPLIKVAIDEINDLPTPIRVLSRRTELLGGTSLVLDLKNDRVEEVYPVNKFDDLTALDAEQAKSAALIIVKLCDLSIDFFDKVPLWVDHSDGSDFWNTVTYMDFVDDYSNLVYFQSVEHRLGHWNFYFSYTEAISALVKWLNASIK